eukprot:2000382-Rhodomonas_salina.1
MASARAQEHGPNQTEDRATEGARNLVVLLYPEPEYITRRGSGTALPGFTASCCSTSLPGIRVYCCSTSLPRIRVYCCSTSLPRIDLASHASRAYATPLP